MKHLKMPQDLLGLVGGTFRVDYTRLRFKPENQHREGGTEAYAHIIDRYAEMTKDGFKFSPLDGMYLPGEEFIDITDGFLRGAADKKEGCKDVIVNVTIAADESDIVAAAARANLEAGAGKPEADRLNSLKALLTNDTHRIKSLRVLGDMCGLCHTRVGQIKEEFFAQHGFSAPDKSIGKDGKTYSKKEKKSGKNKMGSAEHAAQEYATANSNPSAESDLTKEKKASAPIIESAPEETQKVTTPDVVEMAPPALDPVIIDCLDDVAEKAKIKLILSEMPESAEALCMKAPEILKSRDLVLIVASLSALKDPASVGDLIRIFGAEHGDVLASRKFKAGISTGRARYVGVNPDLTRAKSRRKFEAGATEPLFGANA